MPSFYPYLISSLPMLHFGNKPPYSFTRFMEICQDLIPEKDYQILKLCVGPGLLEGNIQQETLKNWINFEIGLRNELVKIRAGRKKIEPTKYLRRGIQGDSEIYHIAMNSYRIPSLIESEKFLDLWRWHKLEELSSNHYFDLDALIVYFLKLSILQRWEIISKVNKQELLEKALVVN